MNEKWINKAHSDDANIIDISKPRAPLLQVIIPLQIFYIRIRCERNKTTFRKETVWFPVTDFILSDPMF